VAHSHRLFCFKQFNQFTREGESRVVLSDTAIVNGQGDIVADFEFEHSLEGWRSFGEKTAPWPGLAVAIETNQGAAVDQLLQRGYTVYPVNPVASESYRKRKAPSVHIKRRGASPQHKLHTCSEGTEYTIQSTQPTVNDKRKGTCIRPNICSKLPSCDWLRT
jgi:hypothetical protein